MAGCFNRPLQALLKSLATDFAARSNRLMTDLLHKDAHVLAALIAAGQLSAVDLMQATLARIAAVNPAVNAIVSLAEPDALLAQARAADAVPASGPLHGLPIAIKDLSNAAGFPTREGSPLTPPAPKPHDDLLVTRLRGAGAIVIGKTNTPAFGLGSHTTNPVFGPTRNPYDLCRTPGGSSGGAAVALATGMLAIADGSDMMGSLRNPAGWCNVYGFRPSWGLVPAEPEGDMFLQQLSTHGPMGRCPEDIALQLGVMAGPDPRRPNEMMAEDYGDLSANLAGRRIGWLGDWGGALPFEDGVMGLCQAALRTFEDIGCEVDDLPAPFSRDALWEAWVTLRNWSVAEGMRQLYADPVTRAALNPQALWECGAGLGMSGEAIHRASTMRSDWFRTAATLFDSHDALVLPTAQCWPFPVEWDWPRTIAGTPMDTYHRWMEVVVPASLIGLPTLAVPAGFGANGLPMGLQLIGRRGGDLALLQLGQGWHRATGWPRRRRPELSG